MEGEFILSHLIFSFYFLSIFYLLNLLCLVVLSILYVSRVAGEIWVTKASARLLLRRSSIGMTAAVFAVFSFPFLFFLVSRNQALLV